MNRQEIPHEPISDSVTTKSTKCSLFQTTRELLVNKTDLRASTLVGPTRQDPALDLLAVLHLDNLRHIPSKTMIKIMKNRFIYFQAPRKGQHCHQTLRHQLLERDRLKVQAAQAPKRQGLHCRNHHFKGKIYYFLGMLNWIMKVTKLFTN